MLKKIKNDFMSVWPKNKKEGWQFALRICLIVLGSFLLAFGTALFLIPNNIVAGGISGIAIIIDEYLPGSLDIVVLIITWVLFVVGIVFLGIKFSLHTLISTLVYPLALMLFYRVSWFSGVIEQLEPHNDDVGMLLLNGIFGGAFVGAGCAVTFLGNGTTGGIDILTFIIYKYTGIKQSISSFVLDATIIVVGMFAIKNNIVPCLVGIISAFASALMIEFVYIKQNTYYVAEIISTDWERINTFLQDEIGRGTTLETIRGGYKQAEHIMIRVAFDKKQYQKIKDGIARIDPFAFVTLTSAEAVLGEGFKKHRTRKQRGKSIEK